MVKMNNLGFFMINHRQPLMLWFNYVVSSATPVSFVLSDSKYWLFHCSESTSDWSEYVHCSKVLMESQEHSPAMSQANSLVTLNAPFLKKKPWKSLYWWANLTTTTNCQTLQTYPVHPIICCSPSPNMFGLTCGNWILKVIALIDVDWGDD